MFRLIAYSELSIEVKFFPFQADNLSRHLTRLPCNTEMNRSISIFVCMIGYLLSSIMPCSGHEHPIGDVQTYVMEKLSGHDIVFMGTTHRQPAILGLMARLVPQFQKAGVTHLALEISSDQQDRLDYFLTTGKAMALIKLHGAIDCPGYRHLLSALQGIDSQQRPRVIAIDLPEAAYGGPVTRDEHMAMALRAALQSNPGGKILAMLGSLHVLRKLPWLGRIAQGHQAIRTYLSRWRPDLRIFSMVHLIGGAADTCDFSRRIGPLPGMVATDVDACFTGWRLGITACLALRPTQPYELVDGVIVH